MTSEVTHSASQHSSRILSFDLARGIAVLFMIMIHVSDFYGQPSYQTSDLASVIQFLGESPAAPVFMFIMGVFIAFAPTMSLASGLKRALGLIALGYLLNFFRASAPMWIGLQTGAITQEELGPYTPLTEFLIVDILQFAGLAFGICIVLRHYASNPFYWLALAGIVTFVSPLLWGTDSDNPYVSAMLAILWGGDEQGAGFPLFPWLVFPLLGMVFGFGFKYSEDKNQWYRKSLALGVILIVLGNSVNYFSDFRTEDYALLEPGTIIWMVGFILVWMWVCRLLVAKFETNKVFDLLYFWSNNVTSIYVIQWLVVCWGSIIVGYQKMEALSTFFSMLVALVLTDLLARLWLRLRNETPKNLATSAST